MKELKLRKPLLVNGVEESVLTYDTDAITNDLYLEACVKSSQIGKASNMSVTIEVDKALHLELGKAAILAVNPSLSWSDLDRITGFDLLAVANVGRFFIFETLAETSEENNSGEVSEPTVEDTTRASQTSESGD